MKGNSTHESISLKQKWLALIQWAVFLVPPLNFISFHPLKSNVNRISFMVGWNIIPVHFILSSCKHPLRTNKSKADSIETGRTVIAHLFPWSDQENYITLRFYNYWSFSLYNFTCSLIWPINNKKINWILKLLSNFRPFERFVSQLPLLPKLAGWQLIIFVKLYPIFVKLYPICVKFSSILVLASKTMTEPVTQRCSVRNGVLRNFAKFIGKHLCQSLFFKKVGGCSLQLYYKRDSGTGVFLWILQNF